uniref:Heat shock protein DnaJ domain protein n=1 Tax=Cyanothece sp. (strain PCC 7425 / ATCC 29141) TaxID=395961 RepID=B8HUL6_CYAP4
MAFQINQGLAKFELTDNYAILGIPISATAGEIRKRYLKIARHLHPDSRGEDTNKLFATQLLSKLVNPAYEVLSQEKQRGEYQIILRLLGQRLVSNQATIVLEFPLSKALNQAADLEVRYKSAVQELAELQYESLDQVLRITGELSELNLVYLLRKALSGDGAPEAIPQPLPGPVNPITPPPVPMGGPKPGAKMAQPPGTVSKTTISEEDGEQKAEEPNPIETYVEQYYRRAEEFMAKGNLPAAILELREALKLSPQNSRCHSLLGSIYLKQNQLTMAKVHIKRALELDPLDQTALLSREEITKIEKKAEKAKAKQASAAKPQNQGFFASLFNRNKNNPNQK